MAQKFANNARTTLAAGIGAADTSLTVNGSMADLFPVANTGVQPISAATDWFKATLENAAGQCEIVYVRTRTSGSALFANLLRAQDGTTARSYAAGDVVGLRVTAKDLQDSLAGSFPTGMTAGPSSITSLTLTAATPITHNGVQARPIPLGGIVMWSGTVATVPAGWRLCDGANGTPDLRDRFIIGARADSGAQAMTNVTGALTKTGGSKDAVVVSHTHSAGVQSADHTHSGTTNAIGAHDHSMFGGNVGRILLPGIAGGGNYGPGPASTVDVANTGASGAHAHGFSTGGMSANHTHAISSEGVSGTNANLVPYFALAFIMAVA